MSNMTPSGGNSLIYQAVETFVTKVNSSLHKVSTTGSLYLYISIIYESDAVSYSSFVVAYKIVTPSSVYYNAFGAELIHFIAV